MNIPKHPNTDTYIEQIKNTLSIPGDIAECGVYKGYNTYHYSNTLFKSDSDKILYAFDSFEGFPKNAIDNVDMNKFNDVVFNEVENILSQSNIVICKGFFDKTLPKYSDHIFSCVILDCDLYKSYIECLSFFYPRLSPGGVIILDEYYSKKYPLARVAVDEFAQDIPDKPEMFKKEDNCWERWRIVKT